MIPDIEKFLHQLADARGYGEGQRADLERFAAANKVELQAAEDIVLNQLELEREDPVTHLLLATKYVIQTPINAIRYTNEELSEHGFRKLNQIDVELPISRGATRQLFGLVEGIIDKEVESGKAPTWLQTRLPRQMRKFWDEAATDILRVNNLRD